MDPYFRVNTIASTPNPNRVIYAAMHQDYCEDFALDDVPQLSDEEFGEIAVKRLLNGNRGHYGCYSADTSVMTDSGWKTWDTVSPADQLLAIDIQSGIGRFEHPTAIYKQELLAGDVMYSAASQRLDHLVTHDHRMVVSRRKADCTWSNFRFEPAKDVAGTAVRYRVTTELADTARALPVDRPRSYDLCTLLRIAGFYYGDGVRSSSSKPRCLRFRLRKSRKVAYLQEHGSAIGVVEPMAGDRYSLRCGNEIAMWVEANFKTDTGKRVPSWLLRLPKKEFLAFMDGLQNSDGTNYKNKTRYGGVSWALDSCEKDALVLIQAAAVLNGIAAILTLNNPNEGEHHVNHRPCWRVSFNYDRPYARFEVCHGRTHGVEAATAHNGDVYCASVSTGALLVSRNGKPVVSGNCLEHVQITLNCGWFPHSVMQQARTHRIGISFDVQSGRYTGNRIIQVAEGTRDVEEVFYLRPVGVYTDRKGAKYEYTEEMRKIDRIMCIDSAGRYRLAIQAGMAEEHARDQLPYCVRQHFVVSFTLRSALHFMDLRAKLDAQLEIRQLCELMWPRVREWTPEIAAWYEKARMHKARLAP